MKDTTHIPEDGTAGPEPACDPLPPDTGNVAKTGTETERGSEEPSKPKPKKKVPPWMQSRIAVKKGHVLPEGGAVEHALEYARLNLRIVPLWAGIKIPRGEEWQHFATCDADAIQDHFKYCPRDNVGLWMGDGTFALDSDPRHGGSLEKIKNVMPLPETAWAKTGGGGDHLLLRDPDPNFTVWGCGNAFGLSGVEIKGQNMSIAALKGANFAGQREPVTGPRKCD
jgi:hypothetical protein